MNDYAQLLEYRKPGENELIRSLRSHLGVLGLSAFVILDPVEASSAQGDCPAQTPANINPPKVRSRKVAEFPYNFPMTWTKDQKREFVHQVGTDWNRRCVNGILAGQDYEDSDQLTAQVDESCCPGNETKQTARINLAPVHTTSGPLTFSEGAKDSLGIRQAKDGQYLMDVCHEPCPSNAALVQEVSFNIQPGIVIESTNPEETNCVIENRSGSVLHCDIELERASCEVECNKGQHYDPKSNVCIKPKK